MKYYTTGEFAKEANVTVRTIQYYDKVGLLKPAFVAENGYRKYSGEDFIKLQKIVALKNLGFSLDEIYPMLIEDNQNSYVDSLNLQIELINKRMMNLQHLKDSLLDCRELINKNQIEWNRIADLIKMSSHEEVLIEEFKNTQNLNTRIKLHECFSTNKMGWYNFLRKQIDFSKVNRLLEIGSGNGELWKEIPVSLRNREIYLSDNSAGMIDELKKHFGDKFSYFVFNAEAIPFRKNSFDTVIANHVLFYLNDFNRGISEIARVLKKDGWLYASTYGNKHMREIDLLVKQFDPHIVLQDQNLSEQFGLENGKDKLKHDFKNIVMIAYPDSLLIDDAGLLFDYIVSCYGNQNTIIGNRVNELKLFLDNKIINDGPLKVTKEAGLFIAQKK